jgi:hypothetical protein
MTFVAALPVDRIDAPWLLDRVINGESLRTDGEQVLAPTLSADGVVINDNLSSPKRKAVLR